MKTKTPVFCLSFFTVMLINILTSSVSSSSGIESLYPEFVKSLHVENYDEGFSIKQSPSGDYFASGEVGSASHRQNCIMRFHPLGHVLWCNEVTVDTKFVDIIPEILPKSSGGCYGVGGIVDPYTGSIGLLLELDPGGSVANAKEVTSPSWSIKCYSIVEDQIGQLVVGGRIYDNTTPGVDNALIIFNESGSQVISSKRIGVPEDFEHLYSAQPSTDGGCYIVCGVGTSDPREILLIKLDSNEDFHWAYRIPDFKVIGDARNPKKLVQATHDGGCIVAGTYYLGTNFNEFAIAKFDSLGNLLWSTAIGGPSNDMINSISVTVDNGVFLGGDTSSFGPNPNTLIAKCSETGSLEWATTVGEYKIDSCEYVYATSDNCCLAIGDFAFWSTEPDFDVLLFKTDENGEIPGCSYSSFCQPTVTDISGILTVTPATIPVSDLSLTLVDVTSNTTTSSIQTSTEEICYDFTPGTDLPSMTPVAMLALLLVLGLIVSKAARTGSM